MLFKRGINQHAKTKKANADTVLQSLQQEARTQGYKRKTGGFDSVQKEEILQSDMHGEGDAQGASQEKDTSPASAEAQGGYVRNVRDNEQTTRSSPRRESVEQFSAQPSDLVRFLSSDYALERMAEKQWEQAEAVLQILQAACRQIGYVPETLSAFQEIWRSLPGDERERIADLACASGRLIFQRTPLLASGVPNRIDRLRALGNAIVPQVAARFFYAMRESA